jgi:hypothetical protein
MSQGRPASLPMVRTLAITALLLVVGPARATDYYLHPRGDDRNEGTAIDRAWTSITRLNHAMLRPGDRIFFEAGGRYAGPLLLTSEDRGTETDPITITSYGDGRAYIDAGDGAGVFAHNTAGIVLSHLAIIGSGHPRNTSDGVLFLNDLSGDLLLGGITLDQVEVSGFGKNGVTIGGWNGRSGFQNVRITHSAIHDNSLNGLVTYAQQPQVHKDVYVAEVESYRNTGLPMITPHSGSGILLGNVDGGTVEWSRAYDNGRQGNAGVGIWTHDSTRILIQHNESYDNHTSGDADGGGFDLDGGVTDSIMQHNYSHDNDGAGYGLFEYADAPPWFGNIVRHNLSVDDGQKNNSAGIRIWNGGTNLLADAKVHGNVVVVGKSQDGIPSALAFASPSHRFSIYENAFLVRGDANTVSVAADQFDIQFSNNRCWSMGRSPFQDERLEKTVCASYFRFP